jgi:hypothetical protein
LPASPHTAKLSPEINDAMTQGIAGGWNEYLALKTNEVDSGKLTSGNLFGTWELLKNNDLCRMAATIIGIYGNSKAEAMYPLYLVDA